jgi:hypothetical protein
MTADCAEGVVITDHFRKPRFNRIMVFDGVSEAIAKVG